MKVVPSTMVAFRKTPFYTELYQGAYTLLVKIPNYPETVEVPFIVEKEDQQEFNFNLDFAELDFVLPDQHGDATIKVDGRVIPRQLAGGYRVGVGSHMVEISKPGYEKIVQSVLVGPREVKSLMYDLTPIVVEENLGSVAKQGALEIGLSYGLSLVSFEAEGRDGDQSAKLTGALARTIRR